eukprot:m.60040 g.60040  ORF g.60040 m.60040 type:complete len:781 (+) comp11795_c0_seq3:157-2499(+)
MVESAAQAHERAAERVAAMLATPGHLNQLELYHQRTLRKKLAVEARLKTAVKSQISDVQEAFVLLNRSLQDLSDVDGELSVSQELSQASNDLQYHIANAKSVTDSRTQMRSTARLLTQILSVSDLVSEVQTMLADDEPNILAIHSIVMKLEACRDDVISRVEGSSVAQRGLEKAHQFFETVQVVAAHLEQLCLSEGSEMVKLVQANPARLVSILRVVEREEQLDKEHADSPHRPKRLRQKLFDKLALTIENKFDNTLFNQPTVGHFIREVSKFYFHDLAVAQTDLPPRCPPSYDIFNVILQNYHSRLCFMTSQLRAGKIEPGEIMLLLNWIPDYRVEMKERLGVDVATFDEQLLGVNVDDMRMQYIELLKEKMSGWVINLVGLDAKTLLRPSRSDDTTEEAAGTGERDATAANGDDSTADASGLRLVGARLVTDTPHILFQMIQQQLDVALQPSGGTSFCLTLLQECYNALTLFQKEYAELLLRVQSAYTGENTQPRPAGLVEHVMAVVNNSFHCTQFVTELLVRIGQHFPTSSNEYLMAQSTLEGDISNGFLSLSDTAARVLVDLTFQDVVPDFKNLFILKWLRSRSVMLTIVKTLEDYFHDFQCGLEPSYCMRVLVTSRKRVVILYLRELMSDSKEKYKPKSDSDKQAFVECMEAETDMIRSLFATYNVSRESTEFGRDPTFALTYARGVLVSAQSLLNVPWTKMRSDFPDFTWHHLEALVALRNDCSRRDARKLIDDIAKRSLGDKEPSQEEIDECQLFVHVPVNTSYAYTLPSEQS